MAVTAALGRCAKCHADLCMSGSDVVCIACGQPAPDHPLMVNKKNGTDPRSFEVPSYKTEPQDNAISWLDRILFLERQVAQLKKDLAEAMTLRREIADLRALLESDTRRKRSA